jgi:hypothetical protein
VNQASSGNLRAMSVLLGLLARVHDPKDEPGEQPLSDHDREILEKFTQREGPAGESETTDVANEKPNTSGGVT